MTISEITARFGVCTGDCGLSDRRHRLGVIDPFGTAHYANRRFTRRAAKNLLVLIARRNRTSDTGYLNVEVYDWWYVYDDSVTAERMALGLGFRLPARLFDRERAMCRLMADRRGVKLSAYRRVMEWSRPR